MKKKYLLFFIVCFSAWSQEPDYPQLNFDPLISFEKFKWDKEKKRFLSADGETLIITASDAEEKVAAKILKNKLVQLKLLFSPQSAAYPGMLTKGESCAKSAAFPKKVENNAQSLYWFAEMPAATDLSFGNCGARPEPLLRHTEILYCKQFKKIFEISFFTRNTKRIGKTIVQCASSSDRK